MEHDPARQALGMRASGIISGLAAFKPITDGKGAADCAKDNEHDHGPSEWRRFCNGYDLLAKPDSQESQDEKSDGAADGND